MDDEGYGGLPDVMNEPPPMHDDGGIGFEDGQLNDMGFAAMGFDNQGAQVLRETSNPN